MCSHEKTKTTFTILRTACEGGLPNYCCFTVVGAFCFLFFFFGTIILLLFICVFFLFFFCFETVRGQRYIYGRNHIKKFCSWSPKCFCINWINLLISVCWFHSSFIGKTVVWLQKPVWCSQQQILMLSKSNMNIK